MIEIAPVPADERPGPGFAHSEEGAVTVDWVVLAAAVVLLAIPVTTVVRSSVSNSATDISSRVVTATN